MKTFNSFEGMAAHFLFTQAAVVIELHTAVDKIGAAIEKTAKAKLGTYQPEVSEFAGWVELTESTKQDRLAKGFTENDPLLRSGELRNSISRQTHGLTTTVGSTSDIAVYQELGTSKIPPRSFIGPSLYQNDKLIKKVVGIAAARGLLESTNVKPSYGEFS